MTGHGHANMSHGSLTIDVEIRTVNNRFLKVVSKLSEWVAAMESQIELLVRDQVKRGTVQLSVRVSAKDQSQAARVCQETLRGYIEQANAAARGLGGSWRFDVGTLLQLPGVLENPVRGEVDGLADQVAKAVQCALEDLNRMRLAEGEAMAVQLRQAIAEIQKRRGRIEARAPSVIEEYRRRLETKVRNGLADLGQGVAEFDLLREVLLFSDRCDIREELVRLASHLEQFERSMAESEPQGRRLDFLIQELFREVNTIGSKANDASVAHEVVAIKTMIEQMRELVQNIE